MNHSQLVNLTLLAYFPHDKPDVLQGFFGVKRLVLFGSLCLDSNTESLRTIHFDGTNVEQLLPYLNQESIDVFVNYCANIALKNISALNVPTVCVVADTHFLGTNALSSILKYLSHEPYDQVFLQAKYEHAHFFENRGIMTRLLPRAGAPVESINMDINQYRPINLAFIGYRVSHANIRSTRLLNTIIPRLKAKNIELHLIQRQRYEKYLETLSQSKMVIICTANSQFTPQIYLALQMGALCIIDRLSPYSGIERFLIEGTHYIAWDSFDDLCIKVEFYMKHEDQRSQIAQSGQQRAIQLFPRNNESLAVMNWLRARQFLPVFAEPPVPRIISEKDQKLDLDIRLNFYEQVQEWHRMYETINVEFLSEGLEGLASDIADLNRLRINELPTKRNMIPTLLVVYFKDIRDNLLRIQPIKRGDMLSLFVIGVPAEFRQKKIMNVNSFRLKAVTVKRGNVYMRIMLRILNIVFPKFIAIPRKITPNIELHSEFSLWQGN